MLRDQYKNRSIAVRGVLALIVLVFIVRLLTLQLSGDYKDIAEGNAFYRKTLYAPRGLIYDRNGKLLVYNQPTYDLMVTVKEMRDAAREGNPLDTAELCALVGMTVEQFEERMEEIKNLRKNPGYSQLTPQRFMTQLSPVEYAVLQEQLRKFPGFSVQSRTLRNYNYPYAAHVLGAIGEVSQRMIDRDPYYRQGDYAGVSGIERSYERELRGENGVEILLRDARGRIKGRYKDGAEDRMPVAGKNLITTIDIDLQMLAEDLLQGKTGSIVAIEPETGEILAMASSPAWNPSHMVGRLRSKYYPILLNDDTKPLLNRATQGTYSPGSTFKTLQALVCLQEGAITTETRYPCNGPGSVPIKCTHHHGSPVSLGNAIEQSCNPYFWQAYRDLLEMNGYGEGNENFKAQYEVWREHILSFGLGPKFEDTDIAEQSDGGVPTIKTYNKWYGERGWRALTIRSNAIGQGEVVVTPLQLANAAAVIANGGYYITPHLNRNDSMKAHRHETTIDARHFEAVREGMWRVCEYGTGRFYKIPDVEMCGKTGTKDYSQGKHHSIFFGFAPKDEPRIAIAVVIENAGFGSVWASPIASLCIEQYLKGHVERKALEERMKTSVIDPNVKKF